MTYKGGFNFSRINNFGRRYAAGKYLLLLNNDVEVINGDWLTQMVGECSQPGVRPLRGNALLSRRHDPARRHHHGAGRYAGHSHKYHKRGGSGVYVPAGHGAGFLRRDSGLPAGAHRRLRRAARPG